MTITIDVCWLDKIGHWAGRNSDKAKQLILVGLIIAAVPVFILGILMIFQLVPDIFANENYTGGRRDEGVAMSFMYIGGAGTIIFIYIAISTLRGLNEEKHWFKIKHCDKNGDCN
jgi:Na+/melibiose symporter-like transporter